MNTGDVIFLRNNGQLTSFGRVDYTSEDLLQQLLENHPELLSGEQLRPGDPVRWLFVAREAGVPDGERGGDRWSLDHLFLDQNATPTLIEVKRSSDTRIRREVVGQMLDYAANASHRWPRGRIREMAVRQHGSEQALDLAVATLRGTTADASDELDAYWQEVDDNLASGRLRLLFVADRIPTELRRIIEFLNTHMPAIEVLGVEIAQYSGASAQAFVPRVVGQTEAARGTKQASRGKTTEAILLDAIPDEYRPAFERLLRGAEERGFTVYWGTKGFSIRTVVDGRLTSLFYGYPPGANGLKYPLFTAYLAYLTAERQPKIREIFVRSVPFQKSGEYSLNLQLEPGKAAIAERAVDSLWEVLSHLGETPPVA